MKKNHVIAYLGIVTLLFITTGCAKYRAQPLYKLYTAKNTAESQEKISLSYHVFSKKDCKKYLGRNVIAKGYQPVQIILVNNTNESISISPSDFSFPCVDPQEVAKAAHISRVKRAACYCIGGILLLPLVGTVLSLPLAVPALIDNIKASKANSEGHHGLKAVASANIRIH